MFYSKLERACKEKGTSPSALVLSVGMSKANITSWKNGASPTVATVSKLAAGLGVSLVELIDDATGRD